MVSFNKIKLPEKGMPTIDIIFAIILLISTLSTALCVYQATRWNGNQATDYGQSAQYRTESLRASEAANSQEIVDVQVFLTWLNAVNSGDLKAAHFLKNRFRQKFLPAFDAWIAEANTTNPVPAGTPFALPEYTLAKRNESVLLEQKAAAAFALGNDANENGDLYISNTVLFAIVLFFCGVYSRWESIKIRTGILIVTLLVFSFALYSLGALLMRVGYI
jgi:hypothetical protein